MSRRALCAGLCALAAVAFLLAAFLPWFESRRGGGGGDDDDSERPRASYQLQGGERCERGRCKDLTYTGGPGLRDDVFAVLGWTTLAGALGSVTLMLAVAAARRRHRPLRAWAAASAATTAGLGAMFVASETVSRQDDLARGWGLAAVTVGAIVGGIGLALPATAAAPDRRPERRWLPALGLMGGAAIAWLSLTDHGWWHGVGAFRAVASSPLAREVCDGDDCQSGALLGGGAGFAVLGRLTVALAAALLLPALGAAARVVQGRAAGAWGAIAAGLAAVALACGAGAAALHPAGTAEGLAWGLPGFASGLIAVIAAALIARGWVTATEAGEVVIAAAPPSGPARLAPRVATPRPALAPLAAAGARPVLAPLGARPDPSSPLAAPPTDAAPDPYAASSPIAAAPPPIDAAPNPYVPASPIASAPNPYPPSSPIASAPSPIAAASAPLDARSPFARPPSPYAPPVALATAPPGMASTGPRPPPGAPSPAWVNAPREQFVPPRPDANAGGPPVRGQVVTAAPLARRASPTCPTCKQATLWHGKRGAWWCSACKRAL